MALLQTMRQGRDTIDEFNTKFRVLVQKARLDEDENASILIGWYAKAIGKELAKRIIIQEPPTTLSGFMTKASTLDGYERRANQFFANAIKLPHKGKPWKPRMYEPKEYQSKPMVIGRLDPQEEKR